MTDEVKPVPPVAPRPALPKRKPHWRQVKAAQELLAAAGITAAAPASAPPVSDPPKKTLPPVASLSAAQRASLKMKSRPNWDDMSEADEGVDRFHIPKDMFPDGMDFQWVTVECYGQLQTTYRASHEKHGWTPVHPSDFDGLFEGRYAPRGTDDEINVGGLVLMTRPLEYSIKSREKDRRDAILPAQLKQKAILSGDIPGVTGADHPAAVRNNKFAVTREPIPIPKD